MAQETQKYVVTEILEGKAGVFKQGLKKDGKGKTVYLKQVKDANGKPDAKKTKVMVSLVLPSDKNNENEKPKFISACVTLENATKFKEAGIDLGKKSEEKEKPIRVRYSFQEWSTKNEDGTYTEHLIREIMNVGVWNSETKEVDWVKKPQSKPDTVTTETTPEVVEVNEDDLPF